MNSSSRSACAAARPGDVVASGAITFGLGRHLGRGGSNVARAFGSIVLLGQVALVVSFWAGARPQLHHTTPDALAAVNGNQPTCLKLSFRVLESFTFKFTRCLSRIDL